LSSCFAKRALAEEFGGKALNLFVFSRDPLNPHRSILRRHPKNNCLLIGDVATLSHGAGSGARLEASTVLILDVFEYHVMDNTDVPGLTRIAKEKGE
jgi:hypothetical protein